ncbi:MAG: hypothetical protein HS104_06270 [Polyangiaceae bacterium]|nr:hypothetical protein [Polyangiaceae bacterium]MCL4755662.1 hypothetical protein [Myxococcales bacterium]
MQTGYWLGIDVGSARDKVLNFALISADAGGTASVVFERGAVRGPERASWPRAASDYLELGATGWLSEPVRRGVDSALDRSALVQRWLERRSRGTEPCGLAIDAPCGFAAAGWQRATEAAAATSHATATREDFLAKLVLYREQKNDSPLFQRYIWKLVGLRVMHELAARAGLAEPDGAAWPAVSVLCVSPDVRTGAFMREAFPSDTYARANGKLAVLRDDSRAMLDLVVSADWQYTGNDVCGASSVPTGRSQQRLGWQREAVLADLAAGRAAVPSMRKIEKDPSWADLWDSLACAFVAFCESQGCAQFVLNGADVPAGEGAITAPVSVA